MSLTSVGQRPEDLRKKERLKAQRTHGVTGPRRGPGL